MIVLCKIKNGGFDKIRLKTRHMRYIVFHYLFKCCILPVMQHLMMRVIAMTERESELKSLMRKRMMMVAAQTAVNLNRNTKVAYSRIWQDFMDHIDGYAFLEFSDISKDSIVTFLAKNSLRPSAYNQSRSAVFRLLNEIVDSEIGDIPRLESMKRTIKAKKKSAANKLYLSREKLMLARDNAASLFVATHVRERNILIFDMLMATWVRVDEIALIQVGDVDFEACKIGIRGKGAASDSLGNRAISAYIAIPKQLIDAIQFYVNKYRVYLAGETDGALSKTAPLFTGNKGKLHVETIKKDISSMIIQVFKDEGKPVPRNHGAHCIRRSMAKMKFKETNDIMLVQRMLRHASQETTRLYLDIENDILNAAFC